LGAKGSCDRCLGSSRWPLWVPREHHFGH